MSPLKSLHNATLGPHDSASPCTLPILVQVPTAHSATLASKSHRPPVPTSIPGQHAANCRHLSVGTNARKKSYSGVLGRGCLSDTMAPWHICRVGPFESLKLSRSKDCAHPVSNSWATHLLSRCFWSQEEGDPGSPSHQTSAPAIGPAAGEEPKPALFLGKCVAQGLKHMQDPVAQQPAEAHLGGVAASSFQTWASEPEAGNTSGAVLETAASREHSQNHLNVDPE